MSNDSFKTAMRELKEEGKANTENTPIIEQKDLQKLYNSMFMSPETPYGLANKVQFDIRYYFFRRGQENMEKMRKDTFEICVTMEGKKCVKKKDGRTNQKSSAFRRIPHVRVHAGNRG
jgi:hypothetical protein